MNHEPLWATTIAGLNHKDREDQQEDFSSLLVFGFVPVVSSWLAFCL